MYNMLGRRLRAWETQQACLKEEYGQSSGPGTRVSGRTGGMCGPLLCPTHGDLQLREATASP